MQETLIMHVLECLVGRDQPKYVTCNITLVDGFQIVRRENFPLGEVVVI